MAPAIAKSLSRLPTDSLVDLCLKWTKSQNATPYLTSNRNPLESDEEDYLHEPVENVEELRKLYSDYKHDENRDDRISKPDLVSRIVDGDWRRGLSLQQLADIDFAHLEHNDTALRWSALKLVPFKSEESETCSHPAKRRKISRQEPPHRRPMHYPTTTPSTFVANLRAHIGPVVKAHYSVHKLSQPGGLVVLRLYIVPNAPFAPLSSNVPRGTGRVTVDSGRVMYIALPNSCPYVYVSLSGGAGSSGASKAAKDSNAQRAKIDIAAAKRIILESIPKALSKPQERWSLENTKLTCRSLKAIGLLRGNGRPGTAGGCYSKFSEEYGWKSQDSVNLSNNNAEEVECQNTGAETKPTAVLPLPSMNASKSPHEALVTTRFGTMATTSHAKLDRFHLSIDNILKAPPTVQSEAQPPQKSRTKRKRRSLEDIEAGRDPPSEPVVETEAKTEPAPITITFSGSDVFAGLKELALVDGGRYVDLDRLPSWMTGEKGVSGMTV